MSAPPVLLGCTPVRQVAPSRGVVAGAVAERAARHLRQAAEDVDAGRGTARAPSSSGVNSKFAPSVFGVHERARTLVARLIMPSGCRRSRAGSAAWRPSADSAGVIESSNGSASVGAETAQKRAAGQRFLVMIISSGRPPHLKRRAVHDRERSATTCGNYRAPPSRPIARTSACRKCSRPRPSA